MMQIPEGNSCPVNFPEVLRRYIYALYQSVVQHDASSFSGCTPYIHVQSFPEFPTSEASRTETTKNWASKPVKSLSSRLVRL